MCSGWISPSFVLLSRKYRCSFVCFSAWFWNRNDFVFNCQIFFGPESQIPALMSSTIERHISPYFSLALLRGSHLQGHVRPSQALWDQAEASSLPILTTSLCSQEATATPFWKQVGGGKTLFFFFFLFSPSPFILLQALIIEGLNLSCSCLLPSHHFLGSVSNKGLWFGFEDFFSFFFSPPEI